MKKQVKHEKVHELVITILLTVVCYLTVNNFIVSMSVGEYLLIEFLLVAVVFFHMFVMKKYFPSSYTKQEGPHNGTRETYPLKDTNDPTNRQKTE